LSIYMSDKKIPICSGAHDINIAVANYIGVALGGDHFFHPGPDPCDQPLMMRENKPNAQTRPPTAKT